MKNKLNVFATVCGAMLDVAMVETQIGYSIDVSKFQIHLPHALEVFYAGHERKEDVSLEEDIRAMLYEDYILDRQISAHLEHDELDFEITVL